MARGEATIRPIFEMRKEDEVMRLTARVRGRVQGVSFRYATQQRALRLNLTGWVRNENDGSVSVVAEGSRAQLGLLLRLLRAGPPSARVDKVDVAYSEPELVFDTFSIKWM